MVAEWDVRTEQVDGENEYSIVVTDRAGAEIMWIGFEELLGSIPPRHTLSLMKRRLEQNLDNPKDYSLAGDVFALAMEPVSNARRGKKR